MKLQITIFLLFFISPSLKAQNDESQIRSVMSEQEQCWNEGDIECFMQGYWKSEDLVFVGRNGLTYGWETTLANYKKNYPDRAAMGKLTFTIEILEPLSEDHWFMVGKWELERETDDIGGYFTLIWRKLGNEWVIVSDHTS